MYRNSRTGERVHMCWLDPGKELTVEEWNSGGEELFVISGSIRTLTQDRQESEPEEYCEWGWLRFPPGERRPAVTASSQGALLYLKTGHLTSYDLSLEKIQIDPENEAVVIT